MNYPDEMKIKMDKQAFLERVRAAGGKLGCRADSCFCTGRCNRTEQEERAYQEREKMLRTSLKRYEE